MYSTWPDLAGSRHSHLAHERLQSNIFLQQLLVLLLQRLRWLHGLHGLTVYACSTLARPRSIPSHSSFAVTVVGAGRQSHCNCAVIEECQLQCHALLSPLILCQLKHHRNRPCVIMR